MTRGDLWSHYRRYPYLTRLRDRTVLDDVACRPALGKRWLIPAARTPRRVLG